MNLREQILFAGKPIPEQEALEAEAVRNLNRIYGKYSNGQLSAEAFKNSFQRTLVKAYESAYAAGKGDDRLSNKDRRWVNSFAARQFDFLEGFMADLQAGDEPISNQARIALYGGTVKGVYWKGAASEFDGSLSWILGPNDNNCEDCVELADNSPYEPENLPTTPGAGDTQCLGNCHCTLVAAH